MTQPQFCSVLDHLVDGVQTQRALIDALSGVHERWLRHRLGYRGAQFLASSDGHRVLSLVRWDSESDFEAFEVSSEHGLVMADIGRALDGLAGLTDTSVSRFRLVHEIEPEPS